MKEIKHTNQAKPLPQLIDEVNSILAERGYGKSSRRHYGCILNVFKQFSTSETYSDEEGARFLAERYGVEIKSENTDRLTSHTQTAFRAMMILSDYYHGRAFAKRRCRRESKYQWAGEPLKEFEDFLQTDRFCGWSKGFQTQCFAEFKRLSVYLHENRIKALAEITPAMLVKYLSTSLAEYSSSKRSVAFSIFRTFFRFVYISEYHHLDLSESIPSVRRAQSGLSFDWADGAIDRLLSCIDRGNPTEARDYAMILLISRLGLRISDVKNLRMSDVVWEENRIELVQQKTKEPLVLPLLKDVGEAIIDYLRFYRPPSTEDEYIFLSHAIPFERLSDNNDIVGRLNKYIERAGIEIPINRMKGPHSLRHALAVKLIDNNISLLTISGILGHTDIRSTADYLRVNVELLRQCTLSPEVNCNVR